MSLNECVSKNSSTTTSPHYFYNEYASAFRGTNSIHDDKLVLKQNFKAERVASAIDAFSLLRDTLRKPNDVSVFAKYLDNDELGAFGGFAIPDITNSLINGYIQDYKIKSTSNYSISIIHRNNINYLITYPNSDELSNEYDFKKEIDIFFNKINELRYFGNDRQTARFLMNFIETKFSRRDFVFVNALLSSWDFSNPRKKEIIALMRTTFRARAYLSAWRNTLAKASVAMELKGFNSRSLFTGLFK